MVKNKIMSVKKNIAQEVTPVNNFIVKETEEERLRRNIFRSDMEKFRLFTKMLRTSALYKKATITHK